MDNFIFDIETPLQFRVHTTHEYWQKILLKHPELEGRLKDVKQALLNPVEVRKSRRDDLIFLFYSDTERYWICVVAKQDGAKGFLVTAYITDSIKEGERVWPK